MKILHVRSLCALCAFVSLRLIFSYTLYLNIPASSLLPKKSIQSVKLCILLMDHFYFEKGLFSFCADKTELIIAKITLL